MVVGILVIVLMSLPLCCGVLKQYGKVLGAIGIVLGVLALVIPLFGALGSCVPFVDAACNDACTPCTDEEKKIWASACQTLGIIFVYLVVFGWAACVLGIVGVDMAAMRSLMVASSDAYAASLWGGSIGGMVVGILVIVLMSLPLCCGVLKQYGKAGKISLVGGTVGAGAIGIVLGVLALVIPLFGALGSCVPFVDAACNDACTPCTDEEKKIGPVLPNTWHLRLLVVFGWQPVSWAWEPAWLAAFAASAEPSLMTRGALKGSDAVLESDAPNARLVDSSWQCPGGNRSVLQFVGSFLSILKAVVPIRLNSGDLVMNMNVDMAAMRSLMVASSVAFALACRDVNGFDQATRLPDVMSDSRFHGGMVVGILVIVLMSLPLCCGVLKQYGKVLGAIGIVLGVLALVIPLFGALGSCVPFVDAACNDACTPCTDEEKK
ncbi:unnamed protein product, partial [Cladocopium goreaui]